MWGTCEMGHLDHQESTALFCQQSFAMISLTCLTFRFWPCACPRQSL